MTIRQASLLLSAVALLAGCTTSLGVQRAPGGSFNEGVPQVLPFSRYEITATWRLASCESGSTPPRVVLGVDATAGSEDDPNQSYLIDANSLQGPLNTSQFDVSYHEGSGTLRTINAEVEDRSAAVIANVVRTAVAFAPALMGAPATAFIAQRDSSRAATLPITCKSGVVEALEEIRRLEGNLETLNDQVATATAEVAVLAAAAIRMNGAIDPVTSQRYGDAIDNLERLASAQAGLAAELATALEPLTAKRVIRWPDNGNQFDRREPVEIAPSVLQNWFDGQTSPSEWPQAYFALRPAVGNLPARVPATPANVPAVVRGVPYRTVARGRLVTCTSPCTDSGGRTVIEGPVAQLGAVNVLPVRNPPFGSTSFSAEFRRDGTLVSAGYAQRTAPLESATGALAGAAEALGPLFDPTARLNRETAYMQALQQRRAAVEALQPASSDAEARAALEAETTLLNAQISNVQARLTLEELQARMEAR
jgi:hypothetical protein